MKIEYEFADGWCLIALRREDIHNQFPSQQKRGTFCPICRNTYAFIYKNAYIVYTILNFIAYISQKFFISYN